MQPITSNPSLARADLGVVGATRGVDANAATEASVSGVSWAAILGGAAAAAALSLILLVLGSGLGFSAMSPWADKGADASTLGISAVIWLTLTQIVASGMGGYLAGRLRVKWSGVHADEVYFRDTAHGFLAWGVATLVTAAMLSSAIGGIAKGTAQAGGGIASTAVQAGAMGVGAGAAAMPGNGQGRGAGMGDMGQGYAIDSLFRGDTSAADGKGGSPNAEAASIFGNALRTGEMSADDRTYLGKQIASRTGISQPEAEKRVADAYAKVTRSIADAEAKAKQAAETARKSAAYASLWMFIALLAGAFCASLGATYGGRQRDLKYA